jgi:mono/diheme cytochrome c family protein
LVGPPNGYPVDDRALAQDFEEELRTNMRARRDFGWQVALKALEPVPLLGLADQLAARPDCPEGVADRDLDKCSRQRDQASCEAYTSGEHNVCGWDDQLGTCAPVCDNLKLDDGSEIPNVPRFQTWYGVEDITHIFKTAYDQLSDEEKFVRAPFDDEQIGAAFYDNNTKKDRLTNWPLRRYTKAVDQLFGCELEPLEDESEEDYFDRCAKARQSQFSGAGGAGGGIARILYTPAVARHMVSNYAQVLDCADDKLSGTWCEPGTDCTPFSEEPENFSTCFTSEFPADAGHPYEALGLPALGGTAVVKLTWSRIGFDFELPAFDTDAEALQRRIAPGANALWSPEGDRQYAAPAEVPQTIADIPFPTPDDIYTIQTRGGSMYRLTGMHVMTKETRHWVWVTLWWSDKPDEDFGADRPAAFGELDPAWSNYKMCVAVDYTEADTDPASRYGDIPSLQAALEASGQGGAPSWCSNPYIEHGAGNARTNCIGCHQHAGTREFPDGSNFGLEQVIADEGAAITDANPFPHNGRTRRRDTFATDYSWAFSRMDDLTELIRKEVEFENVTDGRWDRLGGILGGEGDVAAGELVFRETDESQACTDCHGEQGEGGFGPNLESRFAQKTDWELLYTVIEGRGGMPAWGEGLTDEQLTDLMAYLRATFADAEIE